MSQKQVAQKLLIKPGYRILIVKMPADYMAKLGKTEFLVFTDPSEQPFDLIQLFVSTKKQLQEELPKLKQLIEKEGLLWVTYPKGKPEINRDSIREFASTLGLQAVSLVAVDETWSALRLRVL